MIWLSKNVKPSYELTNSPSASKLKEPTVLFTARTLHAYSTVSVSALTKITHLVVEFLDTVSSWYLLQLINKVVKSRGIYVY